MKKVALFFLVVFIACKEKTATTDSAVTVLAQGSMPAITTDENKIAHLVYGSGDSILYSFYDNKKQSFAAVELVSVLPGLIAFATRGPQIAATANGIVIIAADKAGDIFSFVKNETGKWMKTARVNDADTTDKEGFIGLSSDNENNLFAIWPDLRGNHHNKIFGARSTDGGKTWMKNILVYASPDGNICECCKPSVVMNEKDVYIMFRNWLHGNRDLYLIQSRDGGETFDAAQKLGKGSWQFNACPMDGGGLAINKSGAVQTVWRRQSKIYACEPGKDEKEIGEGKGCSIATVNEKNIYAWSNDGNIICLLPGNATKILGKGSLPLLKPISSDKFICVWQDAGEIKSSTLQL